MYIKKLKMENNNLELYLIRHGESEINHLMDHTPKEDKILAGATFWAQLSPDGIEQSRALGRYLRQQKIVFDKIVVSPCVRTQQTLRYSMEEFLDYDNLCLALSTVEIAMDLREHYQGIWEGRLKREIDYDNYVATVSTDPEKFWQTRFPGGESPKEVGTRIADYLEKNILGKGFSRVGLYTHRGAITWILHHLFKTPIPVLFANGKGTPPASIAKVYFDSRQPLRYELNAFIPTD